MWEYRQPTEIVFGDGLARGLAARAAALGRRCLVVTDRVVARVPAAAKAMAGVDGVGTFDAVEPNPTVANVNELATMARELEADVLLAVGGGSVIDCAKAAAAIAPGRDGVERHHTGGAPLECAPLPLVAVPTTAGTGSEVTPFAVLDDRDRGVKAPLASPRLYPALALVDPLLTHSMPRFVSACTGLDALSHAMEAYWSKNHQPVCDLLALDAARRVFAGLPAVLKNPADAAARGEMALAALLAGMAFQLPKNAMVHACSYPLSSRFHLPHGAACAFTLEFAVRLNAPAMHGRMEAFTARCGFGTLDDMVAAIRELKRKGGLPATLADAGIAAADVEELVRESFHPLIRNNPVEVTEDDLRRMYEGLQ